MYRNPVRMLSPKTFDDPSTCRPVYELARQYKALVARIERAYEAGRSPLSLEEKAAELLERIESTVTALDEEGEPPTGEPDVNRLFAIIWDHLLTNAEYAANLDDYLKRGSQPLLVPAHEVISYGAGKGPQTLIAPASYEYPYVLSEAADILGCSPGDLNIHAVLEAAKDAYDAYMRYRRRPPSRQPVDLPALVRRSRAIKRRKTSRVRRTSRNPRRSSRRHSPWAHA